MGTFLLNTPIATVSNESIGGINALFTGTTAVCITGLTIFDTATTFSLFGQAVILFLIQIGSLGILTMSAMVFLMLGRRISLKERLIMQQSLNQFSLGGIVGLTRNIFIVTLAIEALGGLLLSLKFVPQFGWAKGIYYSIFHSVSAFCNAGFDLMGDFSSFSAYTGDLYINLVIIGLVLVGSLGFTVILEIRKYPLQFKKWSLHSKIVVVMTCLLISFTFLFILLVEYNNDMTLGQRPIGERLLGALFQASGSRTAGISTIDIGGLTDASKFIMLIQMFIGGSPTSTAGGIRTSTLALILLTAVSVIRGRDDINVFKRRIPNSLAARALAISIISLLGLFLFTIALSMLEAIPFIDALFQSSSALSTNGLSVVDTGGLRDISKLVLSLAMFMGRVGPLTLTLALARKHSKGQNSIRYAEEKIMVG